jgi:hypothetical protein
MDTLLLCRNGALAYERAEPEVRRQLIQAAFDKLWVVGAEITGADLKSGFVTLLDDELVTELKRAAQERRSETADGLAKGTTYYRRAGSVSLDVADLELSGIATAEEDLWLPAERPMGRLPPGKQRTPQRCAGSEVRTLMIWWTLYAPTRNALTSAKSWSVLSAIWIVSLPLMAQAALPACAQAAEARVTGGSVTG